MKKIYIEISEEKDIYKSKRESVPKAGGHPTQVYSGVHPIKWMDSFLSGDKISIEERARESHTRIDGEVGAGFAAVVKATQVRWKFLAQFHWRFRYKKFAREECYLDDGDNLTIET